MTLQEKVFCFFFLKVICTSFYLNELDKHSWPNSLPWAGRGTSGSSLCQTDTGHCRSRPLVIPPPPRHRRHQTAPPGLLDPPPGRNPSGEGACYRKGSPSTRTTSLEDGETVEEDCQKLQPAGHCECLVTYPDAKKRTLFVPWLSFPSRFRRNISEWIVPFSTSFFTLWRNRLNHKLASKHIQ